MHQELKEHSNVIWNINQQVENKHIYVKRIFLFFYCLVSIYCFHDNNLLKLDEYCDRVDRIDR